MLRKCCGSAFLLHWAEFDSQYTYRQVYTDFQTCQTFSISRSTTALFCHRFQVSKGYLVALVDVIFACKQLLFKMQMIAQRCSILTSTKQLPLILNQPSADHRIAGTPVACWGSVAGTEAACQRRQEVSAGGIRISWPPDGAAADSSRRRSGQTNGCPAGGGAASAPAVLVPAWLRETVVPECLPAKFGCTTP